MSRSTRLVEPAPYSTPEEKPTLPGSPAAIAHPTYKRFLYFFIGLFVAISGSLANGFTTTNLPLLHAEYGLTPSEAA